MPAVTQSEGPVRVLSEAEVGTEPISTVAAEEEISLLDLLIVVVRRWRLIVYLTLGIGLVGLIVAFLLPSRYTATTSILPPQQSNTGSGALLSQLGSLGSVAALASASAGLSLKNPNDLQVALLRSRTVEDAMIDRFHLGALYGKKYRSDVRKKLEKYVAIDSGAKDGLIRLSVTDRDPHRAAEMANGYVDEFRDLSASLAVTEASQRRLFFEQQLTQAKDNLANAEEDLKKTEQKTGLIELDSQARAIIESVAQLRAQIAAKEVQIRGMRSFATDENPDLQMAEEELAGLQAQQQKMGATEGDSNELLVPRGVMPQSGLEYVRKLRDVKYYETIFDLLARQYEAAKVDEARQGGVVQVVDRATVPDKRSSPQRLAIALGSAAFGLFLGLVWAFTAEGLARLSNSPEERARLEALKQALSQGEKRA